MTKETFYLSKYALSGGVKEVRGVLKDDYVSAIDGLFSFQSYRLGRDIFERREDAVTAANRLRMAKIASLQKQIKKLEGMEFK